MGRDSESLLSGGIGEAIVRGVGYAGLQGPFPLVDRGLYVAGPIPGYGAVPCFIIVFLKRRVDDDLVADGGE